MIVREFKKEKYSEWVIRNSLYWLSGECKWVLEEKEDQWEVYINNDDLDMVHQLCRLMNDYLLREKLMRETEDVRKSIALAVMKGIEEQISKCD